MKKKINEKDIAYYIIEYIVKNLEIEKKGSSIKLVCYEDLQDEVQKRILKMLHKKRIFRIPDCKGCKNEDYDYGGCPKYYTHKREGLLTMCNGDDIIGCTDYEDK